ncbi:MAG TPA: calcium-binding protein, partial [Tepidisphaeraceae bacterium]|nr:calcium-binding protein [Tepidisphaeraceae bacterium]
VRASEQYGAVSQPMFFLGAAGNDTLISTTGDDALIGSTDNDVIVASKGNNYLDAGPGADKTFSGVGNDTILGGGGGDYILDAGGTNTINAPGVTVVKAAIPATIAGVPQWSGGVATPAPTPVPTPVPQPPPTTPPVTPGQTANGGSSKFVIGVWSQSPWRLASWKARGINTAIGYESMGGTVSVDQFSQYAQNAGLMMIRHPNWANLAGDKKWSNLIGWMHDDEPDGHGTPASKLQADYAKMKAAWSNMPVMVNFNGSTVLWGYGTTTAAGYQAYMKGADWISQDLYPIASHNRPSALDAPGLASAKLAQLSGGKRQIAVIEAADMELPNPRGDYPGVTADQFRAEVFNAVIAGATGIVYFPQRIGKGFLWENMTPAVEAEMVKTNGRLARLGDAIMSAMNPAGVKVAADNAALKVTWRKHGGKTYMIVLNNSAATVSGKLTATGVTANTTATVDGEGRSVAVKNGQIADTFKPYEAHVYVV